MKTVIISLKHVCFKDPIFIIVMRFSPHRNHSIISKEGSEVVKLFNWEYCSWHKLWQMCLCHFPDCSVIVCCNHVARFLTSDSSGSSWLLEKCVCSAQMGVFMFIITIHAADLPQTPRWDDSRRTTAAQSIWGGVWVCTRVCVCETCEVEMRVTARKQPPVSSSTLSQ